MDMRERIARALHPHFFDMEAMRRHTTEPVIMEMQGLARERADAVLAAMRTPTEEMVRAGNRDANVEIEWSCAWSEDSHCETCAAPFDDAKNVWQNMIDAASPSLPKDV